MARIVGFTEQQVLTPVYRADGTIASGGTPQLILPRAAPRSSFMIQNTSASDTLYFEFGCARAKATVSNGAITAVTVTNAGFGFTYPPIVKFLGGGNISNGRDLGLGYPNQSAPSNFATAHCVLSGGAVSSIVIDNPGIKEVQMWTDETTLRERFTDIEALAAQCKFHDCKHGTDTGCEIRSAVESGKLDAERYRGFLKLDEEIEKLRKRRKKRQMTVERRSKRDHKIKARNRSDRADLDRELKPRNH